MPSPYITRYTSFSYTWTTLAADTAARLRNSAYQILHVQQILQTTSHRRGTRGTCSF